MLTKKLPVGIDSFEKLRREDFYYVDKSRMIVDLMANWGEVNLFTRPRRFGKTLNMSMLKCFFEIGTDKSLFDGLRVSEEKELCEKYMGKYPAVFVSLKDVDGLTFEDAYDMLREIIRKECVRLQFLMDSDALTDAEKEPMKRLLGNRPERVDIKNSLALLCSLLEKHYGQKPILLIDEYDVPLQSAFLHGYYDEMLVFLRTMTVALTFVSVGIALAVVWCTKDTTILSTWWVIQGVASGGMLGLFLLSIISRRSRGFAAGVAVEHWFSVLELLLALF